jgi:hypothetical protein
MVEVERNEGSERKKVGGGRKDVWEDEMKEGRKEGKNKG